MYLTRTTAKGNTYVYLRAYYNDEWCYQGKKYVYSFGRADKALEKMKEWKERPNYFPSELKELGLDIEDVKAWIKTIETGVTKEGKKFHPFTSV